MYFLQSDLLEGMSRDFVKGFHGHFGKVIPGVRGVSCSTKAIRRLFSGFSSKGG